MGQIGDVFASGLGTRGDMARRRQPLDSAHRIGPYTHLREVLTADEGVCRWRFENCEIGCVLNYCGTTSEDTEKWMVPLDSGHQIGVEIILNGFFTVFGRCSRLEM